MFLPLRGLSGVRLYEYQRAEGELLQISHISQGVQGRTRSTVANVASDIVIIGPAIVGSIPIARTRQKESSDEINETQMHLVAELKCGQRWTGG